MSDSPQTLLVLGARSDIARAVAHRYASMGWNIILAARKAGSLEPDVQDLRIRHKVNVSTVEFDAVDFDSHVSFVQNLQTFPDTVLCAFGYMKDQQEVAQSWPLASETIMVNYAGAASILHHIANAMEQRGAGTIIGISSVAGDRGRATNYYYGSAKAGFTALLSGMRGRLKPKGVHVLTVKPGFVATAMTEGLDLPQKLVASPERVAADIERAARKRKAILYTPWFWRYIMLIFKWLPESIFQKMKN
ncbi:MAG: SDR family oxidoreductase [Bacteroidia bacterium]